MEAAQSYPLLIRKFYPTYPQRSPTHPHILGIHDELQLSTENIQLVLVEGRGIMNTGRSTPQDAS